jgi:hypothetical protein
VQQTQQNYKGMAVAALTAWVALVGPTAHAGIAVRDAPEPLLHDGAKGPCDPQTSRPDFVAGVDVNGNPVAPADLARAKTPVPDGILVPLRNQGQGHNARSGENPVMALNGKTLDPILNSAPACSSPGTH